MLLTAMRELAPKMLLNGFVDSIGFLSKLDGRFVDGLTIVGASLVGGEELTCSWLEDPCLLLHPIEVP